MQNLSYTAYFQLNVKSGRPLQMINHSASQTLLENQSSWQDKFRLARQPGAMPKLRIKQRFATRMP